MTPALGTNGLGGQAFDGPKGTVEVHAFESGLLVGNPLGDPTCRQVPVYVPPGYDAEASTRYPVLYALASFTSTGMSFLRYDWYQETLPARLDRLIAEGMPPAIVVMVDAMTALGGNQFIDSPAVGPWARHVVEELLPWAEATFRIAPGEAHRGAFGISSGGYGALMFALEHPGAFAAVASHSADCYFEYGYGPDLPRAADGLRRAGGLEAFLAGLRTHPKFPNHLFAALNITAMAHFYSPNAEAPCGIDLPFDVETGERRDDVWARWKGRDPVELVAAHAPNLKRLALLYIEAGSRDEHHLHLGARILASRLRDQGLPHEHVEFDDGHRSLAYRYDQSLPALVRALAPGA